MLATTRLLVTMEHTSYRDSDDALIASCSLCVRLLQPLLQFRRELVEASLAARLQVNVVELGLLVQFRVTEGT